MLSQPPALMHSYHCRLLIVLLEDMRIEEQTIIRYKSIKHAYFSWTICPLIRLYSDSFFVIFFWITIFFDFERANGLGIFFCLLSSFSPLCVRSNVIIVTFNYIIDCMLASDCWNLPVTLTILVKKQIS